MKSTGMVRKIDTLGRIVFPKELRDLYGLKYKTPLEIYVEEDMICLKKYELACCLCDNTENLVCYRDKLICRDCIKNL